MKRSRLRPRNPDRAAELLEEQFGPQWYRDAMHEMPCICCGRPKPYTQQAHHPSRQAGGKAKDTTPQCAICHREFHNRGQGTWQREHGIDLREWAAFLHRLLWAAYDGRLMDGPYPMPDGGHPAFRSECVRTALRLSRAEKGGDSTEAW